MSKDVDDTLNELFKNKRQPSTPTHVRMVNGSDRAAFLDDTRAFPDKLRFTLNQMDGVSFWSFSIWRGPEGVDLLKDAPYSDEYIQCAGSARGMTIEVRVLDPEDEKRAYQFVVGKPGDYRGEPTAVIPADGTSANITVYPDEIFTADEAASVFYTYFETNGVTRFYNLRELNFTEGVGPESETHDIDSAELKRTQLNQAIVAYLGKGRSSFPRHDEDAVRALVAKVDAEELLSKVKEVVEGCMSVEIDWSAHTLAEAGDEAERVMSARYPELDSNTLDALRWAFTYNNK